jgi:peptide/nickel transport system substrate-binding protein
MKGKLKYFLIFMIVSGLLVGCTSLPNEIEEPIEETPFENIEPSPTYGGEIKVAIRNPETLNPIINKDRTIDQLLKLVFEPLFMFDDEHKPVANLVSEYKFAEEGRYIELKLKDGITWHDGQPLTADDVVFTINQLKNANQNVVYKQCVANIARVTKVDDLNVIIYFNQASSVNLYSLVFPIIPSHYYEGQMQVTSDVTLHPIGNGMYQFDSYTSMKEVVLTRYDEGPKGKPFIDQVVGMVINDSESDFNAFNQNLINVLSPSVFNWNDFAENDNLKVINYTSYYYDFIGYNFDNTDLQDLNIRKAVAYAIDREEISRLNYLNHTEITDAPIHPDSWLADNEIKYSFDAETAENFLGKSGWLNKNEDQYLIKDQKVLSFRFLVNNEDPSKLAVAELIKGKLEAVGIRVELNSVDAVTYNEQLAAGQYDLVLGAWKLAPTPDLTFAFHSSAIASGSNFIKYNDPKMDSLLENAYNAYSEQIMRNNYIELINYIQEELPYFSLYFRNSAVVLDYNIYGDLQPDTYNIYSGFENLFIN